MPRTKKVEQVVDENKAIALAIRALCEEKNLPVDIVKEAVAESLRKAYFKYSKDYPDSVIQVNIDLDSGEISMAKVRNVVAEIQDDVFETDPEEIYEETGIKYNVGDVVKTPIDISAFRRDAAMQAKSVLKQKLREAEKQMVTDKYSDKVGDVLVGSVEAIETKHCIIKIAGHTNAYLSKSKMLPNETFKYGQQIKVYVEEVDKAATGAPVIVSRVHPKFVAKLMEQDIVEISSGLVEIKSVSRQPGVRTKVAVTTKDPDIDPSGACIGQRGSRISRVTTQISPEKIDVVNYSENPLLFVADALKPATVIGVAMLDEENKQCRAIVADDQYSTAIGKEAQNVNLAVRLTGWKIDIKSETEAKENGYEYQLVEDLKVIEQAKKARGVVRPTVTPVAPKVEVETTQEVETTTPVTKTVETYVKPAEVITPETKTVEEVKPVEVKPKATKASTKNSFAELEAALNAGTTQEEPTKTYKKKSYKKTNSEEEEEEYKMDPAKKANPNNMLPVYTEEELKALAEEEEAEEANQYDDDIDYDEFDDYYDDEK